MGSIQHMAREAIVGDTYPVKDQLRALGGRWNPDRKAWMVPADKAEEAKVLVNGLSVGAAPKLPSSKDSVENDGRGVVDQTTTLNGVTQHGIRPEDRIVIQYLDDNKTTTLTLSHERNDPTKGVLSAASPLGKRGLAAMPNKRALAHLTHLGSGHGRDRRVSILQHMPAPHFAQKGDGQQRGHGIEYRDDYEHRGPTAGCLLEKGRGGSA
jgi:hypothetical protein